MPIWQRLIWIGVGLLLAACATMAPQDLSYSVLESGQSDEWTSADPGVLVVANPEDIAAVAPHLSADTAATLETLDYAREFALLVLRGREARIPVEAPIQRIVWWGNVLTVQMNLGEESPATITGSPYTLVRVDKGPHWGGVHTIRLVTPGAAQNILTRQEAIP